MRVGQRWKCVSQSTSPCRARSTKLGCNGASPTRTESTKMGQCLENTCPSNSMVTPRSPSIHTPGHMPLNASGLRRRRQGSSRPKGLHSPPTARRRLCALHARRALHVMRTHVVSFSTAHKTVTKLQIVDSMLRKQVPTIILFVLGAALRGIRDRVPHVPHVRSQPSISDGLSDHSVMCVTHRGHDSRVEVTNSLQFITRDWKPSVRGALFRGWFWCVPAKGSWLGLLCLVMRWWVTQWLVHNWALTR